MPFVSELILTIGEWPKMGRFILIFCIFTKSLEIFNFWKYEKLLCTQTVFKYFPIIKFAKS